MATCFTCVNCFNSNPKKLNDFFEEAGKKKKAQFGYFCSKYYFEYGKMFFSLLY